MSIDTAAIPATRRSRDTLRELRRTRQRRRLGDTDWYDVAYRVYLSGLIGLTIVVWLSDAVDGVIGDEVDTAQLYSRGPAIIGLVAVVAFALGVRSGADGGPISIETPDIQHVLLAPLDRRMVMLRPIGQRLRAAAFTVGVVGAILGQLIATEVEGSRAAWAAACGTSGAIVGATFVSTAVISHAIRLPRWAATLIAAIAVGWQGLVAWGIWADSISGAARIAPGNLVGHLALWGIDQRPIDLIAVGVCLIMVAAALWLGGRLRIEPLARRGELVSQLRFAATVQDLRTVVQLRRQLRSEMLRPRPWGRRRLPERPLPGRGVATRPRRTNPSTTLDSFRPARATVWRRDARSLRRLPLARLARVALIAAAAGVGGALAYGASPLFGLLLLGGLFMLGLESLEPLSQEIDRPDITDSFPIPRGWVYAQHLVGSAVFVAIAALIGAAAAAIVEPDVAVGAFLIAVPMAWAGAMGPVVVTVLDAPRPHTPTNILGQPRDTETSLVPPEMAGYGAAIKMLVPLVLSAVGTAPVFVARLDHEAADVARSLIGLALFIAAVVWWVNRRDAWSTSIRGFMEEGRAATS